MKHNHFTKLITLALALVLALGLVACGNHRPDDGIFLFLFRRA